MRWRVHIVDGWAFALGLFWLVVVMALSAGLSTDVGEALTRNTVRLSLAWYAAALCIFMRLGAADWQANHGLGRLARWCWTWALVCFLVHVAVAFHYYHDWSHAKAFDHTRQVGGVGEGLYASYLFMLLWTADVIYWWAWPARYAVRSTWLDRALHGFMLLMIFNATVVFEAGPTRWIALLGFAALGATGLASAAQRIRSP
jgi:hypothetical protein